MDEINKNNNKLINQKTHRKLKKKMNNENAHDKDDEATV